MASPGDTLSSYSNQRGGGRRSWNSRERDSWKCRRRSSSVPRSVGQHEHSTARSRSIERHEEPTRGAGGFSRMRVGVRVRPAFQIEVQRHPEARGGYRPAVVVDGHGRIELRTNGRQRCFSFDYAFDATCQQQEIYESLAAPVVEGCLAGLNGIILAYGQTASGKSHSMGVLQRVDIVTRDAERAGSEETCSSPHQTSGWRGVGWNEKTDPVTPAYGKPKDVQAYSHNQADPGIIPRALSRVFEDVQREPTVSLGSGSPVDLSAKVTVSLLQTYNETVQDLLIPAAPFGVENTGLHVREDPSVGFFVEGLREYTVCSHQEAAALINLGLQQRTTAQTTKNDISSRSHTVLTITLEQRGGMGLPPFASAADVATMAGRHTGSRARSKLVLVDLAGSERGRRSSIYLHQESGAERLREAGFINQSLSALGNVVAALGQAELNRPHIPFRDSKLTRILADALGGNANAALLATVGPAPQNQAESLSTLVFASRCMRVRSSPARHEESDHMEITLRLQAQLSSMKREFCRREALQQSRYETVVTRLAQELEYARNNAATARSFRDPPDRETLPSDPHPPLTAQNRTPAASATAICRRGTTSCASTHPPDGIPAWGDNVKGCAAADSSAGGQTDGTESSEGDGGRTGLARGDFPEETNGTRRATEVPVSGGAATMLEEEEEDDEEAGGRVTEEAESTVWEMIGVALRTLEGVGQVGANVLRQARQADGAASKNQPGQNGRLAHAGEACTPTVAAESDPCFPRLKKAQILQRLGQSRTLCEAQWRDAGSILATALRDKARVEKLFQKEAFERRRQENNARRLRGALRHLLADGENLDRADPYPTPDDGAEECRGQETKPESSNCCTTEEQKLRESLVFGRDSVARPRVADARDSHGSFEDAVRLGHGVALGPRGGSDLVAMTAGGSDRTPEGR